VAPLGLHIRAGVHTGECELREDDVAGIAVHIASRVMNQARPREVLASSTVKELVVGSGLRFADRGPHSLKGVDDEWRLFALERQERWTGRSVESLAPAGRFSTNGASGG